MLEPLGAQLETSACHAAYLPALVILGRLRAEDASAIHGNVRET
jgi:hypothetical protein